jgi:beta-galactosidase
MTRTWLVAGVMLSLVAPAMADGGRERSSMDAGWRFHLGDPADTRPGMFDYPELPDLAKAKPDDFERDAELAGSRVDPVATRLGETLPVVSGGFDDGGWDRVRLPHDWVVALPFDKRGDEGHGFKAIGGDLGNTVGWYRRSFDLPVSDRGRALAVEFDGVYRNCLVWLNGHCLGRNVSGYSGFTYGIESAANYGGRNELVVRVDASRTEGWFYEGAGIYRHVWLWKQPAVHIGRDGPVVTSEVAGNGDAKVTIRTPVESIGPVGGPQGAVSTVFDADGHQVARDDGRVTGTEAVQRVTIPAARLWSLRSPYLYTVATSVGGASDADVVRTRFGIRTIKFDPNTGFSLNGRHVFIAGTCNHQDAAGVGVAIPDALNVWRLEQLKKFGCNAIRTSHNDPTPELLDACDRLGILVMDEHRLSGRTPEILDQLARLVRRDRNHPSVILWSIGNEENEIQGRPVGVPIARAMKDVVQKLDPTRPVTAAMNGGWGGGFSNVIDVQGFNYPLNTDVGRYHRDHPTVPLMASEEASTVSTRGIYSNDAARGYVSAYDVNAPSWAVTAEKWDQKYRTAWPFMAGAFVWTGFDYRGEPTPYSWPCINSHFGVLDTCGFFKDEAYYYQSVWTDKPMVHLLPHWNWSGREGQPIDVWAYSNGDEVELLKGGISLGRKPLPRGLHVSWQVPYAPGTLVAKAYQKGTVVATDTVATTGAPAKVVLMIDRTSIDADGADLAVVNVAIADAQGRTVPTADNLVHFKVDGVGRNIGVGNGDPSCHEPDKADQRSAFNGLCQLIVQSTGDPGTFTVTASSDGLASATGTITAMPCAVPPTVP